MTNLIIDLIFQTLIGDDVQASEQFELVFKAPLQVFDYHATPVPSGFFLFEPRPNGSYGNGHTIRLSGVSNTTSRRSTDGEANITSLIGAVYRKRVIVAKCRLHSYRRDYWDLAHEVRILEVYQKEVQPERTVKRLKGAASEGASEDVVDGDTLRNAPNTTNNTEDEFSGPRLLGGCP